MYKFDTYVMSAKILECNDQTLTIEGLPFWFSFSRNTWIIAGTDIDIIDYIGTPGYGLLYLSRPILIERDKYINITYK